MYELSKTFSHIHVINFRGLTLDHNKRRVGSTLTQTHPEISDPSNAIDLFVSRKYSLGGSWRVKAVAFSLRGSHGVSSSPKDHTLRNKISVKSEGEMRSWNLWPLLSTISKFTWPTQPSSTLAKIFQIWIEFLFIYIFFVLF